MRPIPEPYPLKQVEHSLTTVVWLPTVPFPLTFDSILPKAEKR